MSTTENARQYGCLLLSPSLLGHDKLRLVPVSPACLHELPNGRYIQMFIKRRETFKSHYLAGEKVKFLLNGCLLIDVLRGNVVLDGSD